MGNVGLVLLKCDGQAASDKTMTDKPDDNPRKARHVVAKVAIFFLIFIALYLTGFVMAVKLGPGLSPPISTVLSVVYWPLIKCDENNIEPFNSAIEWLRH
jgi:hypothetical protein